MDFLLKTGDILLGLSQGSPSHFGMAYQQENHGNTAVEQEKQEEIGAEIQEKKGDGSNVT